MTTDEDALLAETGDTQAMVRLSNRLWEGDPATAETWLRRSADAEDPLGMLVLGQRLVEGMGLAADPATGAAWIARAAETGFAPAMAAHGEGLLDRDDPAGLDWLDRAAAAGDLGAMATLGARLWDGGDRPTGETWLRDAAARGFGRAMGLLGERLLHEQPDEARRLLAQALARGGLHFGLVLGLDLYRQRDWTRAVRVFERCWSLGARAASYNLVYMARRGEWPDDHPRPDLDALLAPGLAAGEPLALINQALRESDEATARALMARVPPDDPALAWWATLASQGDPEGARVCGWLQADSTISQ